MGKTLWIGLLAGLGCGGDGSGAGSGPNDEAPGGSGPDEAAPTVGAGGEVPFDPAGANGLEIDPDGALELGEGPPTAGLHVIWVANSNQGTVSKLDTRERIELGRYWTSSDLDGDPSRTTVNRNGDVVVANRHSGFATKILASGCPDRDGNGSVTTSTGGTDVLPWADEECIAWSTFVGGGARGSAFEERGGLDATIEEVVWVGPRDEGRIVELDGATGALTGRAVEDVDPYGAAIGPGGKLWTFERGGLVEIDTTTLEVRRFDLPRHEDWYGLTVDAAGRVWIGGSVARFDPAFETWASPDREVKGAGIAADATGSIWTGDGGKVFRIDAETLEYVTIETGGDEYGWAVDFDGFAWGINIGQDTATVIDPSDDSFVTVEPPFDYPYTYSDMTGFQLQNVVRDRGQYTHLATACADDGAIWQSVGWDAEVPEGTRLTIAVRSGPSANALEPAEPVVIAVVPDDVSPAAVAPAALVPGEVLEVVVTLERVTPGAASPVLRSLTVDGDCPELLE